MRKQTNMVGSAIQRSMRKASPVLDSGMQGTSQAQAVEQDQEAPMAAPSLRLWEHEGDVPPEWQIKIKDSIALADKLKAIKNGGTQNLMIISDFDQTMSKNMYPLSMEIERAKRLDTIQSNKQHRAESAMGIMLSSCKQNGF